MKVIEFYRKTKFRCCLCDTDLLSGDWHDYQSQSVRNYVWSFDCINCKNLNVRFEGRKQESKLASKFHFALLKLKCDKESYFEINLSLNAVVVNKIWNKNPRQIYLIKKQFELNSVNDLTPWFTRKETLIDKISKCVLLA